MDDFKIDPIKCETSQLVWSALKVNLSKSMSLTWSFHFSSLGTSLPVALFHRLYLVDDLKSLFIFETITASHLLKTTKPSFQHSINIPGCYILPQNYTILWDDESNNTKNTTAQKHVTSTSKSLRNMPPFWSTIRISLLLVRQEPRARFMNLFFSSDFVLSILWKIISGKYLTALLQHVAAT